MSSVRRALGGGVIPIPPVPETCPHSIVVQERAKLDVYRSIVGAGAMSHVCMDEPCPVLSRSSAGNDMTLDEMRAAKAVGPSFFTLLRDPVERVLSEYCHHYNNYHHDPLVCAASPRGKSQSTVDLWTSVLAFARVPYQRNFAVAFLSGKRQTGYASACNDTLFQATQRDLGHLINLIDSQWLVAGITEDYEQSIRTFVRELGWEEEFDPDEYAREGRFPATSRHRAENRARDAQIPASIRRKIRRMNHLDSVLYKHAVAFMTQQREAH